MNELLATLTEALAIQKDKIDDINSTIELLTDETKANQDEIIKVKESLTKQIEDIYIQTDKLINKAISTITVEVPNIDKIVSDKFVEFTKNQVQEKKDFVTELTKYINSIMPKDGKDGLDGKDADTESIIQDIKLFILENKETFRGERGLKGDDGLDGKDGRDGVGIEDIKRVKDELVIELTNDTKKKFKIPKDIIKYVGGGTSNDTTTSSGTYTNLTPVPTTLGGILSGTTFDNVEIVKVLDMLLYPYQSPAFTSFAISGLSNLNYEVGYTSTGGDKTFTWTTSNSENVKTDSITLNGVSGLSELTAYSTNEVLTSERWTNGKPIYKKTIDFGALPNNTTKNVAHGITNADVMWLDRGSSMVYVTGTPTTAYGLEFGTNTDIDVHAWSTDINNTSVRMHTYTNRTTFSAYMTVKYTKSTDTVNSPVKLIGSTYNISSTEYVLPYTRNGKTVYGIEIDCGSMPNSTAKNVAIPNYNNAYDYDIVKFKASDATYHINVPIQWNATTYIERWITRASGSLTIVSNFNASSLTGKAVLEYTKN